MLLRKTKQGKFCMTFVHFILLFLELVDLDLADIDFHLDIHRISLSDAVTPVGMSSIPWLCGNYSILAMCQKTIFLGGCEPIGHCFLTTCYCFCYSFFFKNFWGGATAF